ncbi:MAG: hypothetical protein M1136_01810 [Chloroflexi bacterium]|nr:hypothetical protein [Chloroflexota bacterium]MCL5074375.1 hypothetical protein [Chloroflexota bacterium]
MATSWTNPIAPGSPVRAFDIQEVINAINSNRSAAGLPSFPWTDPTVLAGTPVKAVHFTEMRAATQDLWNKKGMGRITPWRAYGLDTPGQEPGPGKPIYAQDLLDVRRWLNQYEDAPATVTVKTLKGMHMPAGGGSQFRQVDAWALEEAVPSFGMLVALSQDQDLDASYQTQSGNSVSMATVMNWYANNRGTELFVRLYPGPGPVPPSGGSYIQKTFSQVVDDIVALRNARGTNFRRIIPGNEPNLEWPASGTYHDSAGNTISWTDRYQANFYKAMNAYYKEILDELNRRKANGQAPIDIELYYPPMSQSRGAEGKERYCDNGETRDRLIEGQPGYNYLQESIELYGRFTWHNYFFSWHAAEGCVANYFPQWLKDDLYVAGFPSRITECGWWPDDREHRDRDSGAGTYLQYDCDDANPVSASEGTYPQDLIWFITQSRAGNLPPASGVAVWLLSTLDPKFDRHVAVRDAQRPWYQSFKLWQP